MEKSTADLESEQLRREASALHRAVFGRDIPEEIAVRYAKAHPLTLSGADGSQWTWMQRVLNAGFDVEALEMVLRIRQPDHVLCRKIKVLVYISEAFPEYYADFVNEEPRRARIVFSLALHGLRTLLKGLKGWWLVRRTM
jgi:hypothetical protein